MRAALYARVSTLEQAQTGFSLAAQEEKLRAYAAYRGYETAGAYIDDGYSGASLARPALTRLLDDVKRGRIDVVLIYKLDRLSRKVKNVLELVDLFAERGVALYSLTEQLDLSSSFGRAALKMSATFSELERETIIERTKMGKDQAAKNGKYLGPAPFGYRKNPATKALEIVPEEAEAVKKLFNLYLGGMSFRALAVYARETFAHPYFNNEMSCRPIIRRLLYTGRFLYRETEYTAVNVPPILPYETFLRARDTIEKNRTRRRRESSPYLLTGLVWCGECGNRFVGKLSEQKYAARGGAVKTRLYRNYGCAARVKRDKKYRPEACRNDIIPAEALEAYVENALKRLDFTKKTAASVSSATRANAEAAEKIKRRIERLLEVYLDGVLSKAEYEPKAEKLKRALREAERTETESEGDFEANLSEFVSSTIARYDAMSRAEKRKLLKILIEKIVVTPGKITIFWRVG